MINRKLIIVFCGLILGINGCLSIPMNNRDLYDENKGLECQDEIVFNMQKKFDLNSK